MLYKLIFDTKRLKNKLTPNSTSHTLPIGSAVLVGCRTTGGSGDETRQRNDCAIVFWAWLEG